MKRVAGLLGIAALGILFAMPTFAAGEGASSAKPLSFIEFSNLAENQGADVKLVIKKYDAYRSGRVPAPTLDVSRMR